MKIKRTHWISLYCTACFCLLFSVWVRAYQVADGSPVVPLTTAKYIFYWGKFQCDLSPANNYSGQLECTVPEFRQLLHRTPYLWTGTGMAAQLSFKLEGYTVHATRGENDYTALIGTLDEAIGQKVEPGQLLRITDIELDGQTMGRIDLVLQAVSTPVQNTLQPTPWSNYFNVNYLEKVVWGREDIYDNSNRDFFSETEFWQSIQQLPYLEWVPYVDPQPVNAGIQFHNLWEAVFGMSSNLDAYSQMVESLGSYRHLTKPGAVITLNLHTAQHDRLFEKNMYIVADDDPRLALRRNRDTHTLEIKWGGYKEKIENLYLLKLTDARGATLVTDPPAVVNRTMRKLERKPMLTEQPEFRIDGQPVPDMVFRLSTQGKATVINSGQPMPDLEIPIAQEYADSFHLLQIALDSFHVPGYEMPDLHFVLNFYAMPQNLRVRNQLESLKAAPESTLVKLHEPAKAGDGYAVDIEVLEETDAKLSVFTPEGENLFSLDNKYPPGRHTVELPRMIFRQPGRYFLFLNTVFGVARQEWVLE